MKKWLNFVQKVVRKLIVIYGEICFLSFQIELGIFNEKVT